MVFEALCWRDLQQSLALVILPQVTWPALQQAISCAREPRAAAQTPAFPATMAIAANSAPIVRKDCTSNHLRPTPPRCQWACSSIRLGNRPLVAQRDTCDDGSTGAGIAARRSVDVCTHAEEGFVSFTDEERAELIGALSRTADMVAGLLDALDVLRVDLEAGRQPTEGDMARLREHSALWRRQLEKLRSRLTGLTIEPPTRVQ